MIDLAYFSHDYVKALLLFVRCASFLSTAPFFSSRNISMRIRAFLCLWLTVSLLPLSPASVSLMPEAPLAFCLSVVSEALIGLILGFSASIVFAVFQVAGQILDMQLGFGMLNVLDPQTGIQVPLMGNLLHLLTIMIFLAVDGHHYLLRAFQTTLTHMPLGQAWGAVNPGSRLLSPIMKALVTMFATGVQIATPVLGALFLADLALAIVARTVPQLNVFVVGLPIKSLLGFVVLGLAIPVYGAVLRTVLMEVQYTFEHIVLSLPP